MKDRDNNGCFLPGHQTNAYSDEELASLLEAYCVHLANGYDKLSFTGCHYQTVEKYAQRSINTTEKMRVAVAKGRYLFETMLRTSVMGTELVVNAGTKDEQTIRGRDINVMSLIFAMKNKYRETYGDKVHNTNDNNNDNKGSYIVEIIGPDGKPVRHSIAASNPLDSGTPDNSSDDKDFSDAMQAIGEMSENDYC